MMDDRELIELAAKAAGYELKESAFSAGAYVIRTHEHEWSAWHPLNNEGDALRLAINLQIDICFGPDLLYTQTNLAGTPMIVEKYGSDPSAATRRAIVRAAAAMGSGKP